MSSECVVIETYFVQHHFKNRYLGLNEFELQVPNLKIANCFTLDSRFINECLETNRIY